MDLAALLSSVSELVRTARPAEGEALLAGWLDEAESTEVLSNETSLREAIEPFNTKRRNHLKRILESRLARAKPAEAKRWPPSVVAAAAERWAADLSNLSRHHIFQWSTHYRDVLDEMLTKAMVLVASDDPVPIARALRGAIRAHAAEIYGKGYAYQRDRNIADAEAVSKSVSGLQRFLELPIEFYGSRALRLSHARDANALRYVCSSSIAGILRGYGDAKFESQVGGDVLPLYPRSWAYYLVFLQSDDFEYVTNMLGPGPLKEALARALGPVLRWIEAFAETQQDDDFCLTRLGEYHADAGRFEVSISLPRRVECKRDVFVHCYVEPTSLERQHLEESLHRNVAVVAASFRADLQAWLDTNSTLGEVVINITDDGEATARQVHGLLRAELVRLTTTDPTAVPVTQNFAEYFPLDNPFVAKFYLVPRRTVRDLLRTSEQATGVRLWCSVRRSGKTTACFDLSSTTQATELVTQSCASTDQHPDSDRFYRRFQEAMDAGREGRRLSETFVADSIRDCAGRGRDDGAKIIFVLDEYETIFDHMRATIAKDEEVRYTVVQPMLGQFVSFSRTNLIIFVGQRPDAHYIIMDQNQLVPYVRRDTFPLFEHVSGTEKSEFVEFLRRVLTERVEFDAAFVDAVYAETGGHPFLTVNTMVYLFAWFIGRKRRANQRFGADDFVSFANDALYDKPLANRREFEFFARAAAEALGDRTRCRMPWLHAVYSLLRHLAKRSPLQPQCGASEFASIVEELALPFDPVELLDAASASNFLVTRGDVVQVRIPILARVAASARIATSV